MADAILLKNVKVKNKIISYSDAVSDAYKNKVLENGETYIIKVTADNVSDSGLAQGTYSKTGDGKTVLSNLLWDQNAFAVASHLSDGDIHFTTGERTKLYDIEPNANKYIHPTHTAASSDLYKIEVDAEGHVKSATEVTKDDITALGIPAQDTKYSAEAGISLTGTTFSNAGVRSITQNTTDGHKLTINTNGTSSTIEIPDIDTHNSHAIISGKKADGTTDIQGSASDKNITLGDSGVTAGEYGPTSNQTPAYGSTFNVPDIKVNTKGIVTSVTNRTVKIPASDNTDTKVTAVGNHYTPVTSKTISASSTTAATWGSTDLITGIEMDAAGHVTGVTSIQMPANPDTGATSIKVTGDGNAITEASYDASTREITLTKGATYNNYSLPAADAGLGGVKTGGDVTITNGIITVNDDSHDHVISNIDGLQTALDQKLLASQKGAANGVAELDANGKVPTSQLPAYVDDVLEYDNKTSFPASGETGKIYVAKDTNITYRWGGSEYVEISASLALGTTSSTAFRGDYGNTAYGHSQKTSGNPHNVTKSDIGLGDVVNTGDSPTPVDGGTTKFTTGGAYTELNKKVDKVAGKGLSTEDYTTSEKTKLAGIASGAEVNVQSDWSETNTSSNAYIKNKPTIPTVNNGTLTIQKNGTNVTTFSANQSGDATANITIAANDITAMTGYSKPSTTNAIGAIATADSLNDAIGKLEAKLDKVLYIASFDSSTGTLVTYSSDYSAT